MEVKFSFGGKSRGGAREGGAILVLILLVLGAYLPPLFSGRVLADDPALVDVSFNFMPNLHWMVESWGRGEFPLWNPHTHCGMPHLGYSHSGGLYPATILIFSALPYPWAVTFTIIFHSLLAALLFYWLLREYDIEPLLATGASLIFVLSGAFFGTIYIPWTLGSLCGLLVAWIFIRRLVRAPRLPAFLGSSMGVAWCGLSGDVELLAYGLLLLGLLIFMETGLQPRRLVRAMILFFLPVIAGFLIISPLALSTIETVHFSIRGPAMPFKLSIVSVGKGWPFLLPTVFFPLNYFFLFKTLALNSGLSPLYQGFLMPGILLWGLVTARSEKKLRPLALAWLILFLFVIARIGEHGDRLLQYIPVLGDLHYPTKAFLLLQALALILGFQVSSEKFSAPIGNDRVPFLGLMLILGGALAALSKPWCMGGGERYLIAVFAAALGAMTFFKLDRKAPLSPRFIITLALLLMVCEVVSLNWRYHPRTDPARFDLDPGVDRLAHRLAPETRFAVFESLLTDPTTAVPLFGRFEVASGACNLIGPSRVIPARTFLFLSQIYSLVYTAADGEKILDSWAMTDPKALARGRMHLFSLAGLRLVLGRDAVIPAALPFQRSAELNGAQAFQNQAAQPRAFIAHQPVVINKWEDLLAFMDDPAKFLPLSQVVLERETPEVRLAQNYAGAQLPSGAEGVEIKFYGSHRVEMLARLVKPGFLVFTDSYFPGWRARVQSKDGEREARIFPADLAFRALFLTEGEHRITWTYQPVPFRIGLWAGLVSLLLTMVAQASSLLRSAGWKPAPQSPAPQ